MYKRTFLNFRNNFSVVNRNFFRCWRCRGQSISSSLPYTQHTLGSIFTVKTSFVMKWKSPFLFVMRNSCRIGLLCRKYYFISFWIFTSLIIRLHFLYHQILLFRFVMKNTCKIVLFVSKYVLFRFSFAWFIPPFHFLYPHSLLLLFRFVFHLVSSPAPFFYTTKKKFPDFRKFTSCV